MRRSGIATLALLVSFASPVLAQQGKGNECTPAGVWYGGSVVAYRMIIIPAGPAGHYMGFAEPMYKNSIMSTAYAGELVKNGEKYEGFTMALNTQDPAYLNLPPFAHLPDMAAGWMSVEMVGCDVIKNTMPFLGVYFGVGIWEPGTPWTGINWVTKGKVPFQDQPDLDLIPVLTGDTKPIVETYHRVLRSVNPALLHHE